MIPNWLLKRSALTPHVKAITFQGRTWTYQELYTEATACAGKLRSVGLAQGNRVALLGSTSADMAILIHSCLLAGVEMVLLNTRLSAEEIAYQLDDSQAEILLYDESCSTLATHTVCKAMCTRELFKLPVHPFEVVPMWDENRTLTIMYTSGTTGFPKGVRQTAGNHTTSAISAVLNSGLHEGDTWLHMMPLFHISGFSILARAVLYGTEVRLYEKFDAEIAADEIANGRVTGMSAVAVTLERLLSKMESTNRTVPSTFRTLLVGGGPVPMSFLKRAEKFGLPVLQTYGMTETSSQTATLSPLEAFQKIGSAGKPLFFAEIKIKDTELPYEKGEILIKGPHVTRGYIGRHAKHTPLRDGWLHSGDIGYFDEEGFLFVTDRRSDLIISGGENIYPAELEAVLAEHPAVVEAGVCAMPDSEWGAVPAAFVVTSGHTTVEDLEHHCRLKLASYKVPKLIRIVDELPRNASNKLVRSKLREKVNGIS